MPELLPCPFCGSDLARCSGNQLDGYGIICTACHAEGPFGAMTDADAIAAWNRRAETPADRLAKAYAEFSRLLHKAAASDQESWPARASAVGEAEGALRIALSAYRQSLSREGAGEGRAT